MKLFAGYRFLTISGFFVCCGTVLWNGAAGGAVAVPDRQPEDRLLRPVVFYAEYREASIFFAELFAVVGIFRIFAT